MAYSANCGTYSGSAMDACCYVHSQCSGLHEEESSTVPHVNVQWRARFTSAVTSSSSRLRRLELGFQ